MEYRNSTTHEASLSEDMMKKLLFTVVYLFSSLCTLGALAQTPAISIDKAIELRNSANGNTIRTVPANTSLILLQVIENWAQVEWVADGAEHTGWVEASSIEVTGSSSLNSAIKRNFIAKSQDCAWHKAGRGKVCVDTRDAILDCRKAATADFWQRCEVNVSYDIYSELRDAMSVDANVECDIEIEYKLTDSFNWKTLENKPQNKHQIDPSQRHSVALISRFNFPDYEQVTNVKIENLDCEINTP